ncbi:hypothetical protein N0V93_003806 [Gnomoniopsis smithogilvyi]|uniref:GCN5-related N-acetyltransferase Rv2170-like domain-containing protein n=1 Tax=Gnomoniopsis smithogilvyi TaxID=1191159 RepID=A0A9W9D073_9PEZI|nr:hypothetical protein N0V93_003806 [Gnomoniopsis smithogilvyi]
MAPSVLESTGPVPDSLLTPLKEHLPHSFAVLRRAQFTHFPHGTSPYAHFFFASDSPPGSSAGATSPTHYAAAYLDLSVGPETQMFLYSTLQDTGDDLSSLPDADVEHVLDLCTALFARVRQIAAATAAEGRHALHRAHGVMVGNFHEATYRLLVARRGLASSYWNPHDVWLFRVDELPPPPPPPPQQQQPEAEVGGSLGTVAATAPRAGEGLVWSVVHREDVPLIASRTSLPKVADTLMSEPSVAVRDAEGTLIAWGFMGIAGTLSTLHVEEPYRGRGIAKALATKVLREHSFGDDQWGSADVHVDNVQSQGLCKSLGAKKGMRTCWTVINFDSMP